MAVKFIEETNLLQLKTPVDNYGSVFGSPVKVFAVILLLGTVASILRYVCWGISVSSPIVVSVAKVSMV